MANILLELNCDSQTLGAAWVYPSIFYHHPGKELITKELDTTIYKLIIMKKSLKEFKEEVKYELDVIKRKRSDKVLREKLNISKFQHHAKVH